MGLGNRNPTMSDLTTFPKLNGYNYYLWARHMRVTLRAHMLWLGHIEFKRPPPTELSEDLKGKPPIPPATPVHLDCRTHIGPIPGGMKTSLNDLGNNGSNKFSPEYVVWEKNWEIYGKWTQNDLMAIGLML